jgi:hypothetical protein
MTVRTQKYVSCYASAIVDGCKSFCHNPERFQEMKLYSKQDILVHLSVVGKSTLVPSHNRKKMHEKKLIDIDLKTAQWHLTHLGILEVIKINQKIKSMEKANECL